jgi:hypothetical protein
VRRASALFAASMPARPACVALPAIDGRVTSPAPPLT